MSEKPSRNDAPERIWTYWPQMVYSLKPVSGAEPIEYVRADTNQQLITRLTEALAALVNADAGGETTPDFERAIVNARIVLAAVAKERAS